MDPNAMTLFFVIIVFHSMFGFICYRWGRAFRSYNFTLGYFIEDCFILIVTTILLFTFILCSGRNADIRSATNLQFLMAWVTFVSCLTVMAVGKFTGYTAEKEFQLDNKDTAKFYFIILRGLGIFFPLVTLICYVFYKLLY